MDNPYIQRGDYVKALRGEFKRQRGKVIQATNSIALVCWDNDYRKQFWISIEKLKRTKRTV